MTDTEPKNSNTAFQDIDYTELSATLWRKKKQIAIKSALFTFIVLVLSVLLIPKVYECKSTFYVRDSIESGGSGAGLGFLFNSKKKVSLENIIQEIYRSSLFRKKLQASIAEKYEKEFRADIKKAISKKQLSNTDEEKTRFILEKIDYNYDHKLSLSGKFFTVRSKAKSAALAFENTSSIIELISIYNQDLNLSSTRDFLLLIDPPVMPLRKKKIDYLLIAIASFIFASFILTVSTLVKEQFKPNSSSD